MGKNLIYKATKQGSKFNRFLTSQFGRPVWLFLSLAVFTKYRRYSDGVDIFNFIFNLNKYKWGHTPELWLTLTIFNINIIEFHAYNINEYEDEDRDEIETVEAPAPYKVD